jgi:ubiquinol-cytochrome c reductase iron-sulfur subunit
MAEPVDARGTAGPGSEPADGQAGREAEPGHGEPPAAGGPRQERPVAVALVIATLAALALAGVYIGGGQPQAEGSLLFVSLSSIGVALVLWAKRLLPQGEVTGPRGDLGSSEDDREATDETIEAAEEFLTRRRALIRLVAAAGGALGLAALFPIRSLGPSPGNKLSRTSWKRGRRLVDGAGRPVRPDTVQLGGILTVFPEGAGQAGDSQVVLIRVEPGQNRPRKGRETWAPQGNLAYSKICPHVGCPVGLYEESTHQLICPCHQSTFDVLDGARPVFGPATRSLPQLPISVDPDGFLVADSDFTEPVGPGFWNRK